MHELKKNHSRLLTVCLLFAGSLLLFLAVMPGNHSEAEDAFEYSRLIEEGHGAAQFHPHHLLYIPMQKAVFKASSDLGYKGRSYYVARAVSMFAGAAALCLFFLIVTRLQERAGAPPGTLIPLTVTLGLLCSYGFLRYACEVEIYVPASALMLASVYFALREDPSWMTVSSSILFSVLAMLTHMINAIPAILVVPLIYGIVSRRWKYAWIHGAFTLLVVGLVYWFIQSTWGTFKPATDTASEGMLRSGTIVKALVGFGQCLLSGNFMFAYQAVCGKLQALFPYRMFAEEMFTGAALPSWLKVVAPVTFVMALIALFVLAGFLLVTAIKRMHHSSMDLWILVWVCGTLLPTALLEPSNPELWIMALAPLWILVAWLALLNGSSPFMKRAVIGCTCLLATHNLIAGMGAVKSREGDYLYKKAEWLLQEAKPNDVINTADSFVFTFYLDYWSPAEVRNLNTQAWETGSNTYVYGDVFDPPASIGVRYPSQAERVSMAAVELQPLCRKIHDDQFGGIWIVDDATGR